MRVLLFIFVLVFVPALSGCSMSRGLEDSSTSANPLFPRVWGNDRVLLQGPGAIQLGPGLGKNAWRWVGDGQWGF